MTATKAGYQSTVDRAAAEIALGQRLVPFTELLIEYASRDSRVCYVGVDTMDVEFQKQFPDRAFDVGIAEQNQLGVATGLANAGMIPIVQAWSPFTPLRNFDQLRTSLARHHSNVKIVTTALGLVNCSHGATHHDMESLALFRTVPGLVILAPIDGVQFEQADHLGAQSQLPPPCNQQRFDRLRLDGQPVAHRNSELSQRRQPGQRFPNGKPSVDVEGRGPSCERLLDHVQPGERGGLGSVRRQRRSSGTLTPDPSPKGPFDSAQP